MSKSIEEKLRILSDAAKYDVSCSSSGSSRKNTNNGLGNAAINRYMPFVVSRWKMYFFT